MEQQIYIEVPTTNRHPSNNLNLTALVHIADICSLEPDSSDPDNITLISLRSGRIIYANQNIKAILNNMKYSAERY